MPLFKSVDLTSPGPIGSTTPNTGAFTTLNTSNIFGAGSPNGGVAIRNSSAATNYVECITGVIFCINANNVTAAINRSNTKSFVTTSDGFIGWGSSTTNANAATPNASLFSDAANILAQRNSTNAQTFRIYNTYTDASNYERGFMRWATNVLEIGAEAAGTGTSRNVSFVQGGLTRLTIGSTIDANVSINCGQFIYNFQGLGARSLSADPTTSNLVSGFYNVFKNTTTGVVKLWYNDGGTMKSVTLA